jgi:hypothetical protein
MKKDILITSCAVFVVASCNLLGTATPAVVDGSCTIVEAVDDSKQIQQVCADAEQLAQIVAIVSALREDAGAAKKGALCTVIPKTSTCATNSERLIAIRAVAKDGGR